MVAELPPPLAVTSGVAQPVANADVLEISVFQVPDLARTVQVDDRGYVSLPLIGAMQASGKSVQMLQGDIETAYAANYLQSPNVSVFVKESAARRVTVDGEVKRAGVYPLPPGASLLDAVALAGGLTGVADPSKVYVFRRVGDVNYVANYKVDNIRQGSGRNPSVYGGDVVVVFASQSRVMLQSLKEALGVATSVGRLSVFVP
jgi:polysaccharide biosynthesis/export protein